MTGSDEEPPNGMITGEDAADIIEAGMEWDGERGKAYGAFVRAGVIAAVENGARVRGMDRYRDAWQKQQRRRAAAKAGAAARWGDASCVSGMPTAQQSHANRIEVASPSDAPRNAQTETETETETEKKPQQQAAVWTSSDPKQTPPSPSEQIYSVGSRPTPADFEPDAAGEFRPTAWGFWGWHNSERLRRGLYDESTPPHGFLEWHDAAVAKVGMDGLARAYASFLADEDFRHRKWPINVFRSPNVWETRANPEPERAVRL